MHICIYLQLLNYSLLALVDIPAVVITRSILLNSVSKNCPDDFFLPANGIYNKK